MFLIHRVERIFLSRAEHRRRDDGGDHRGFSRFAAWAVGLVAVFLCCFGESDRRIRCKLEIILVDDLKTVIAEVSEEHVADTSYYEIVSYKCFEEGKYSVQAVVDFYFLKGVEVKMVRKYRYHTPYRKWERYYNEYQFLRASVDNEK